MTTIEPGVSANVTAARKSKRISTLCEGIFADEKETSVADAPAPQKALFSSVFPDYFPRDIIVEAEERWKELCSSSIFNGDLFEKDILQICNQARIGFLLDADRHSITDGLSSEFRRLVKTRERDKSYVFFKESIILAQLNSLNEVYAHVTTGSKRQQITWADLSKKDKWIKGVDIQPDLGIWKWPRGAARPELWWCEIKAGEGEYGASNASNPKEYNQLQRAAKTTELFLNDLERHLRIGNAGNVKNAQGVWVRPVVKLAFVAFGANSIGEIKFEEPRRTAHGAASTVWELAPGMKRIERMTGAEFGAEFGFATDVINQVIKQLNVNRINALIKLINSFQQPPPVGNANRHSRYTAARAQAERNFARLAQSATVMPITHRKQASEHPSGAGGSVAGAKAGRSSASSKPLKGRVTKKGGANASGPQQARMNRSMAMAVAMLQAARQGQNASAAGTRAYVNWKPATSLARVASAGGSAAGNGALELARRTAATARRMSAEEQEAERAILGMTQVILGLFQREGPDGVRGLVRTGQIPKEIFTQALPKIKEAARFLANQNRPAAGPFSNWIQGTSNRNFS